MKISLSWLKEYVAIPMPVEELCDRMVQVGFEIEEIEDLSKRMQNVVVGKILSIERHPDSDHLLICQVDVGSGEPQQIITGAQNVFVGATVPAALPNSVLPDGTKIKAGKLRGLPSLGMLCSGEELGLKAGDFPGCDVYGILIMDDKYIPGTDMRDVLGLNDYIIDFKITANRPDCNCVLGVVREIAATLGESYTETGSDYATIPGDTRQYVNIIVEDTELCPRYMGHVVRNLRIAESPDWMKKRLRDCGMRPINNIVDITNYVMLETGHPLHAFDLRDIRGGQIVVRRAKSGEEITTLDGKEHALTGDMLVIADSEGPSCLAGIMGGLNSEIKDDTTDLFLESAKFRRDSVRRTARALGMRTEASARYERGVDTYGVEYAMNRALQLIDQLHAGEVLKDGIDCCAEQSQATVLQVPVARINGLLGIDVPEDTVVDILQRLHFDTQLKKGMLTCRVPLYRDDVEGAADLAEEVMRLYGCDKIVSTPMRGDIVRGKQKPERIKTDRLKRRLIAQGMREIATYSFISSKAVDTLRLSEGDSRRQAIKLLNPLGEEYSTLRTQLVTSMLTVLATNYSRKIPAVRFFEASKRFIPHALPLTEQPQELPTLCLGLYGKEEDFFTLKGIVESIFAQFAVPVEYVRSQEPYLHPGRQAAALWNGRKVAAFGEVHPDVAASYGMDARIYVAEMDLAALLTAEEPRVLYHPLPRFPAVERDLALTCDENKPVAEIEKLIRKAGGKLLESVELFDVYQGAQILAGKKSVAYALKFRTADRTLSDADIDPLMNKIYTLLQENDCILRT